VAALLQWLGSAVSRLPASGEIRRERVEFLGQNDGAGARRVFVMTSCSARLSGSTPVPLTCLQHDE
jgi:hypothetical protein